VNPRRGVGASIGVGCPVWLRLLLVWGLGVGSLTGCARYRLYWGDVHGHTANSDGKGTVAEYLRHAREEANLDFAIVSDHDFGNGPPWRMPAAVWEQTQATVEALTEDGRFVAIAGYEWTSQPKYWTEYAGETLSEGLLAGSPRYYNHKNVYFPNRVPYLFSAKDPLYQSPDQLAAAVRRVGGLIHNNHPDHTSDGRDQWAYRVSQCDVIANTEVMPDVVWYEGKRYETQVESVIRDYLNQGGRTGLVGGSDTHEGKPAARTAVYARRLTRPALFEALRARRCYAVWSARIGLEFRIDGHRMGEAIAVRGSPRLTIRVAGTAPLAEVALVHDGAVLHAWQPETREAQIEFTDRSFSGASWYYVRVTQRDADPHGNPGRAWSSPIWVRATPPAATSTRGSLREEWWRSVLSSAAGAAR